MLRNIRSWLRNEKGQGFVEYGLALAIIVIIVYAAFRIMGQRGNNALTDAGSRITSAAAA